MITGFTVDEMCRLIQRSKKTIYNEVRLGNLKAEKNRDGTLVFTVDAAKEYLIQRSKKIPASRGVNAMRRSTTLLSNVASQNC
jgi:hypothetical protein